MTLRVKDLMQSDVVTVGPDLTLRELEEVLLRHRIHGVPVVERGRIVGHISRSDVVRQFHPLYAVLHVLPHDGRVRAVELAHRPQAVLADSRVRAALLHLRPLRG